MISEKRYSGISAPDALVTTSKPSCATCMFYRRDFGTWCVNGWTKMHVDQGECRVNPPDRHGWPKVHGADRCGRYEPGSHQ